MTCKNLFIFKGEAEDKEKGKRGDETSPVYSGSAGASRASTPALSAQSNSQRTNPTLCPPHNTLFLSHQTATKTKL